MQDFTFAQFNTFIAAASRHKEIERAAALQTVALGAQGGGKDIKAEVTRLLGG